VVLLHCTQVPYCPVLKRVLALDQWATKALRYFSLFCNVDILQLLSRTVRYDTDHTGPIMSERRAEVMEYNERPWEVFMRPVC